jgi:hypothetical protein
VDDIERSRLEVFAAERSGVILLLRGRKLEVATEVFENNGAGRPICGLCNDVEEFDEIGLWNPPVNVRF